MHALQQKQQERILTIPHSVKEISLCIVNHCIVFGFWEIIKCIYLSLWLQRTMQTLALIILSLLSCKMSFNNSSADTVMNILVQEYYVWLSSVLKMLKNTVFISCQSHDLVNTKFVYLCAGYFARCTCKFFITLLKHIFSQLRQARKQKTTTTNDKPVPLFTWSGDQETKSNFFFIQTSKGFVTHSVKKY